MSPESGDLYLLPRLSRNATWPKATVLKNDHVGWARLDLIATLNFISCDTFMGTCHP